MGNSFSWQDFFLFSSLPFWGNFAHSIRRAGSIISTISSLRTFNSTFLRNLFVNILPNTATQKLYGPCLVAMSSCKLLLNFVFQRQLKILNTYNVISPIAEI